MGHDAHDMASHVRSYLKIGFTLVVFTMITVGISFIDFSVWFGGSSNMLIGMAVATFKASLVALIFMHLNSERPLIYKVLVFTTVFAIVLFVLFVFCHETELSDEGFEAPRAVKEGVVVQPGT
jgi:caa(3)-type oxidase subunit IV